MRPKAMFGHKDLISIKLHKLSGLTFCGYLIKGDSGIKAGYGESESELLSVSSGWNRQKIYK